MKRPPMARGKRMNPISDRMRERNRRRKGPHAAQLREFPYCEAKRDGIPKPCDGMLTVHEPWTKARGGPQDDRRNMTTVCIEHNRLISQDGECMQWANEHGYLVHAWEGPAWLEAGGFPRERDEEEV